MNYHIDTALIYDKFGSECDCPLCEIQKIIDEQYLHEFLNDAVMEDDTRIAVGKKGFCKRHLDMLISRQNKLSVALQLMTRLDKTENLFAEVKKKSVAKKRAEEIEKSLCTCAICDYTEQSMVKYYKTVAQLYAREKEFYKVLLSTKGFCAHHYAELLKYASSASFAADAYVTVLSGVQERSIIRLKAALKEFCDKHDYRNAAVPLSKDAETSLKKTREKLFGKNYE